LTSIFYFKKRINFKDCPIHTSGIDSIINSLKNNYSITSLYCGKYETDDQIDEIENLLDRNFDHLEKNKS
jgi:hypothetical protein